MAGLKDIENQRPESIGDKYAAAWMRIIVVLKDLSKDESTQVAAIITRNNVILATGHNGFPRGINDNLAARQERPEKYFWMEHAERNAIYNCAKQGTQLEGSEIYIEWPPCADCARAIIQSGIKKVHLYTYDAKDGWQGSCERGMIMFDEAGIEVIIERIDSER